jgi:hypothetical protein
LFSDTVDERSNLVSRPETVGRKNGACSGALGGSFGLFRCFRQRQHIRDPP